MHLHLLRHGDAGDPLAWDGPDTRRPLSDRGVEQAERLGAHLKAVGFPAMPFLTSPKVRASQTATRVATAVGGKVVVEARLAGALDPDAIEAILSAHGDPERVVLVGHDPDFSELLATLIGAPEVPMRKGALARIAIERPIQPGTGILRFLLPPNLVRG
jgi:phosphohistidine phosphatase